MHDFRALEFYNFLLNKVKYVNVLELFAHAFWNESEGLKVKNGKTKEEQWDHKKAQSILMGAGLLPEKIS